VTQDHTASVSTSVITAFVALLPNAVSYAEKLVSVLVLAMVAEAGRKLIQKISVK
jgi:hypothetical protein